jgi:hypothetical protein
MRHRLEELDPDVAAALGALSHDASNPQVVQTEGATAPRLLLAVGLLFGGVTTWILSGSARLAPTNVGGVIALFFALEVACALVAWAAVALLRLRGRVRPAVILAPPLLVQTGTASDPVTVHRLDGLTGDALGSARGTLSFVDGDVSFPLGPMERTWFRGIRAAASAARAATEAGAPEVHPWERGLGPEFPGLPRSRVVGITIGVAAALVAGAAITLAAWSANARDWDARLLGAAEKRASSEGWSIYRARAFEAVSILPRAIVGTTRFAEHLALAIEREDDALWLERSGGSSAVVQGYLEKLPAGRHAAEARRTLDDRRFAEAVTPKGLAAYLRDLPKGAHAAQARARWADEFRGWAGRLRAPRDPADARPLREGLARLLERAATSPGETPRLALVRIAATIQREDGERRVPFSEDDGRLSVAADALVRAFDGVFPEGLLALAPGESSSPSPRLVWSYVVTASGAVYSAPGPLRGITGVDDGGPRYPGITVTFALALDVGPAVDPGKLAISVEPAENLEVKEPRFVVRRPFEGPPAQAVYDVMFASCLDAVRVKVDALLR